MSNSIESIYRYPIKGLSGEWLEDVKLTSGRVMPGDREYAFARSGVDFDPDHPQYLEKANFLALVRDEKLASLRTKFDNTSNWLSLSRNGAVLIEANLSGVEGCKVIAKFLAKYLDIPSEKRPRVVRATGGTKHHSFSDVPDQAISLINLSSIEDFSKKIGKEINPMRFRGNIYYANSTPWQEFDWIDRNLRIGEVVLSVFKRTKRCAATCVNPLSGIRDINVPRELNKHYHHMDMGVYATVVRSGLIKVSDEIKVF